MRLYRSTADTIQVNTIRVYNVDPTINHDQCASIFNSVGIYMIIDVNSPLAGESIDRSNPSGSYTSSYLNRIFGVVENFKNYPNTLGFFSANEVMNDDTTAKAPPPYIRAVTRDLKNYIAKHASRTIPVGYSAADVRDILQDSWNYLQCTTVSSGNDTSRSDFFGLNSYSWCGQSSFTNSGYDVLVNMFGNTTIPVFFSEYGCNKVTPRVFQEVGTLYGPQMTVLSGGLVYEFTQEPSDFGLVNVNDNGTVSLLTDYDNLQNQFNQLNITLIETTNSTGTSLQPPRCSSALITNSAFATDFSVPAVPSGGQSLIDNGISNPKTGNIVSVTATAVPMAVYGSNGQQLSNLAIKPLANDDSNTPNQSNSPTSSGKASGTASSTGTAASATKTGAAGKTVAMGGSAVVVASSMLMLFWL